MSEPFQSNLAQVRSLLAQLTQAWEGSDDCATDLVMDLAEPLHALSWQREFERLFRARFREVFEGTGELAGAEALCQQLAPACTWCMLFVISDLSRSVGNKG